MSIEKSLLEVPSWQFSEAGGDANIVFSCDEMVVRIYLEIGRTRVHMIEIWDLVQMNKFYINWDCVFNRFEGSSQPIRPLKDKYEDETPRSLVKWLTLALKIRLCWMLKRAVSFRQESIPEPYNTYWGLAVQTLKNLDLVDPGQQVFPDR